MMADFTGKQFGPYQIVAPLSEGGMTMVYKAYQPAVEWYVALMVLPRNYAEDAQFLMRFQREAKLLSQLQHPHILPVFDSGQADGYTYIVMPYTQGGRLTDILKGESLPLAGFSQIITQDGEALNDAHTGGLIHQDVKPNNILIDESGNYLLTDSELARMVEDSINLTSSRMILNTPAYMSANPAFVSRRAFLKAAGLMTASVFLASCGFKPGPFPSPTPSSSPVQPVTSVVFTFNQADADQHSVAFAAGTFIDLQASSLGTFQNNIFSAKESGWLERDTLSGGGEFRWAGGQNKMATLPLQIPTGTEGLFLNVLGAISGLQMTVKVGVDDPVTLSVTSDWQTVYVPVGNPTHEPAPDAGPVWSEGHYFPEFPPPSGRIYSFKIDTALEDWWGAPSEAEWRVNRDFNTMTALTLTSMQGIINRSGPRVYLDWVGDGPRRDVLHYWVPVLQQQTDLVELPLDSQSTFNFLWRRFGDRLSGAVVYDPEIADTINLATMIAGLENRVILAPDQLNAPGMPVFDSVTNLRPLAQEQGWDNTPEGRLRQYQWVFDNLWNRLEKRAIGVLSPGPPTTIISGQVYDPLGLAPRDYYIALRLPALWINPSQAPASTLFERFLQDAPSPIPVMSNYASDETGTVSLISRYGDWTPAITLDNSPLSAGNLTVFSGVRPQITTYKATINPDHILATLGDRPVLTAWLSDGDNIHYQLDHGFQGNLHLTWDEVKSYPFAWSTNPMLSEIAPVAWNDYVATAKGASFVSGVSGGGYAYPTLMDDQKLDRYLQRTAAYLKQTGLRTILVDDRFGNGSGFDQRLSTHYYQNLKDVGLLGIFVFTEQSNNLLPIAYLGNPLPIVSSSYELQPGNGQQIAQALLASKPGEVRFDPTESDSGWQRGKIVSDPSASGGKTSLFSRSNLPDCCAVVLAPRMTLAPGNYTVTYRLKVPANLSRLPVAHLLTLQQLQGGAAYFAERWITPADFLKAGEYQDFSITFTLAKFTPDIQLWMDYTSGTSGNANSDLYLDTITLTRSGGSLFPLLAPVFVGQVGPVTSMNGDLQAITIGFEQAGGVVLLPDEFMAAFNTEFMIEFATPYLGANNPTIQTAKLQLQEGNYFESLVTIREALKAIR
jgi:hypothetical protein